MERVASFRDTARILVVDDEEANLRLLKRILERDGYSKIRLTANGSEVRGIVEEFDPHLVLLDLHMPPPDGFTILRALAPRIAAPSLLTVLVLTADASPDAKRTALSIGTGAAGQSRVARMDNRVLSSFQEFPGWLAFGPRTPLD